MSEILRVVHCHIFPRRLVLGVLVVVLFVRPTSAVAFRLLDGGFRYPFQYLAGDCLGEFPRRHLFLEDNHLGKEWWEEDVV